MVSGPRHETLKGDQQLRSMSLSYSVAFQALKPKILSKKKGPGCKHPSRSHGESGEVFSLDILSHRMSAIDSMTMSAPAPELELVVLNPTNRLGRKEPNNDDYRSRLPSRG